MELLILGAGGHGRVVGETALAAGIYDRIAFLDDCRDGSRPEVIGALADFERFRSAYPDAFVAMGNPVVRAQWQEKLEKSGFSIPVLIHPEAWVSPSAVMGPGTVVMAKAVVQANVQLGKGCILSAGAIADHDAILGDYCHMNAGAVAASGSHVPAGTKVDYNQVFRDSPGTLVADQAAAEQHRQDFGTEVSSF